MAHILIVDDDPAVAEVVALVLEQSHHQTTIVSSVQAAKDAVGKNEFAGAIVDVWLKNDDGLDFAGFLSTIDTKLPFIIMSGGGPGRSLETVTARADILGAVSVLYKPFDDDELIAAVNQMISA